VTSQKIFLENAMEISTSPKRHNNKTQLHFLSTRTTNLTFIKPTKGCSTPRTHSLLQMEQTHSQACTKSEHKMLNPELISPVACSMAKKHRAILIKCSKARNKPPSRDQKKNNRQLHFTAGLVPKKSSQERARFFVHQKQDTHNNHVAKEFDELLTGIRTDLFMKTRKNSRNNQKYEQKTYTRF
jgi:hypothetical protein